jgi:hypothetical protein
VIAVLGLTVLAAALRTGRGRRAVTP